MIQQLRYNPPAVYNPLAVRAEVLGALELSANAADIQSRIYRLHNTTPDAAAHYDQVSKITRRLHSLAARGLTEHLAAAADGDDDSYQSSCEAQYAWHTVRLFRGPDLFEPTETDQVEELHPAQCATLPPGASCWFTQDPRRHWWPNLHGTYRLRPFFHLVGGGPDGDDPDTAEGFDIQILDEAAGTWTDWHRPAAEQDGDKDHRGDDASDCPACSTVRHQAQQDSDVRAAKALQDALASGGRGWSEMDALLACFADRIAALDARDAKVGEHQ